MFIVIFYDERERETVCLDGRTRAYDVREIVPGTTKKNCVKKYVEKFK